MRTSKVLAVKLQVPADDLVEAAPAGKLHLQEPVPKTSGTPTLHEAGTIPFSEHYHATGEDMLRILRERYGDQPRVPILLRIFECLVALSVLIITMPVMLLIALIIRRDSPGNPLFRQDRVGRGGKLFRFTKFRTLLADARQRYPELYAYRYTPAQIEKLTFKVPHDPRITRAGRWLRRSTLDELPNFWNVLTGGVHRLRRNVPRLGDQREHRRRGRQRVELVRHVRGQARQVEQAAAGDMHEAPRDHACRPESFGG